MWIHRDSQLDARLQPYEPLLSYTQNSRTQEKKVRADRKGQQYEIYGF